MQIGRISGVLTANIFDNNKSKNVQFGGHFRSIEVEKSRNDVFQARVAGSKTSVTYYDDANAAVYGTIKKAKDYIENSKIEKINDISIDDKDNLGVSEIYYSDRNEQINHNNIKQFADYIVYAPGAKLIQ
ncbi:hypothetical protein IJ182_04320 [bacterium]|nr:hypothetical protein [bacterium]